MSHCTLIVARMAPGNAPHVANLFGESDLGTTLPHELGVRRRSLFQYQGLYFHLVDFAGPADQAMRTAHDLPDFRQLSDALSEFITPYDPSTWRSPADAMAQEFYRYDVPAEVLS
jgi:Polyketide synthesis cyclase